MQAGDRGTGPASFPYPTTTPTAYQAGELGACHFEVAHRELQALTEPGSAFVTPVPIAIEHARHAVSAASNLRPMATGASVERGTRSSVGAPHKGAQSVLTWTGS